MNRFAAAAVLVLTCACSQADPKLIAANESAVISEMRAVLSAQENYAASNYGGYDELRCLAAPHRCIPDYPETAPYFLDPKVAAGQATHGYVRKFHAGPRSASLKPKQSPTSLAAWAYTAVPEKVGQTGKMSFCTDAVGRICATADGTEPVVAEGKCPAACGPLN